MSELSQVVDLIPLPIAVDALVREERALRKQHGDALVVSAELPGYIVIRTPGEVCECIACDQTNRETLAELAAEPTLRLATRMIVCPDCGNKRCPRATHHDNECTGSNAPGQRGSVYR